MNPNGNIMRHVKCFEILAARLEDQGALADWHGDNGKIEVNTNTT